SVEGTLILSSRLLIVPELSSAARMPLPSATMSRAVDIRVGVSIECLQVIHGDRVCKVYHSDKRIVQTCKGESEQETGDTHGGTGEVGTRAGRGSEATPPLSYNTDTLR